MSEIRSSSAGNAPAAAIRGPARVYGRAHINTDEIIPARYLMTSDEKTLAAHAMEDVDPGFAGSVHPGTVLIAGEDFGCGSSREHAVWALRGAGVSAVVAESFARIFFRNAINNGMRVVECPGIAGLVQDGDEVEIDAAGGVVRVRERDLTLPFTPLGEFVEKLLAAGGLMADVAARLARRDATSKADA
jgi:3-isopropylmalate/(R)-2-methylmalate dehydratase small subunit